MFDVRGKIVSTGSFVIFLSPHSNNSDTDIRLFGMITQYFTVFFKDTDGEFKEISCDKVEELGVILVNREEIRGKAGELERVWGTRNLAIYQTENLLIGTHIRARNGSSDLVYLGDSKSAKIETGEMRLDTSGDLYVLYNEQEMTDVEMLKWIHKSLLSLDIIDISKYYVVSLDDRWCNFLEKNLTGNRFKLSIDRESCFINYHSSSAFTQRNVLVAKEEDLVYIIQEGKTLRQGAVGVYLEDGSVFTDKGTITKDFVCVVLTDLSEEDINLKYYLLNKHKRLNRTNNMDKYVL